MRARIPERLCPRMESPPRSCPRRVRPGRPSRNPRRRGIHVAARRAVAPRVDRQPGPACPARRSPTRPRPGTHPRSAARPAPAGKAPPGNSTRARCANRGGRTTRGFRAPPAWRAPCARIWSATRAITAASMSSMVRSCQGRTRYQCSVYLAWRHRRRRRRHLVIDLDTHRPEDFALRALPVVLGIDEQTVHVENRGTEHGTRPGVRSWRGKRSPDRWCSS